MLHPECPEPEQLERALLGLSADDEAEAVVEHLASCQLCLEAAQRNITSDPLIEALRGQRGVAAELAADREHIGRIVRRATQFVWFALESTQASASSLEATSSPDTAASDGEGERYDFLAPARAPDELGRLGAYRVLRVLGEGGMGVVFEAEDTLLHRRVALKAMKPCLAVSADARRRFIREAQTAASTDHENIVVIHQVGDDRGIPFIAMPLLCGETLAQRLERGTASAEQPHPAPLTLADLTRFGREIAAGLAAAHENGLIHRDIKPANIWLEAKTGRVKLLDFGLARAATEDQRLTQSGMVLGTPSYMSPEQARGQPVDHRSDLFSLGCVLYHMATGTRPFRGSDSLSTLMAVMIEEPVPPAVQNADLPPAINELIQALLAKSPADRPQTAQEVADRLAAVEQAAGAEAPRLLPHLPGKGCGVANFLTGGAKAAEPRRVRCIQIGVGAAALLLIVSGAALTLRPRHDEASLAKLGQPEAAPLDRHLADEPRTDGAAASISGKTVARMPASFPAEINWSPGAAEGVLPGIVPRPATLPGIGRWQVATRLARGGRWGTSTVAFSPDGRWLGGVSKDGAIRLYDAKTFELRRVLLGHAGSAATIAWSPDADLFATGGYVDREIRLWSVRQAKTTAVLRGHTGGVTALAWSRDGRLASGASWGDNRVLIWNALGEQKASIEYISHEVKSLAWSPDGRTLAAAGNSNRVLIMSAEGERLHSLDTSGEVNCVACSADGRWLASGGADGAVRLWNHGNWRLEKTLQAPSAPAVICLAFSHDSALLVAGAETGGVDHIFEVATKDVRSFNVMAAASFAFSGDDRLVVSADMYGGIQCWRRDATVAGPAAAAFHIDRAALGAQGQFAGAVFRPTPKGVRIVDVARGHQVVVRTAQVKSIDWSSDGAFIAGGLFYPQREVGIWDAANGEMRSECSPPTEITVVRFSPDGRRLATAGTDRVVRLWSIEGASLAESAPQKAPVIGLAWRGTANQIVAALDKRGEALQVFEAAEGSALIPERSISLPMGRPLSMASASRGDRLVIGSGETVCVWHGEGSTARLLAKHPSGAATAVAASADGQWIASGGTDGTCRLWTPDGLPGLVLRGHGTNVTAIAFVDADRRIICASRDGTVREWDTASGAPLLTTALLANDQVAVYAPGGELRFATPRADEELLYVVEEPSGEQQMLTPDEFRERVAAACTASAAAIAPMLPPPDENR